MKELEPTEKNPEKSRYMQTPHAFCMNQVSKSYAIRGKKEVHVRLEDRGYNE